MTVPELVETCSLDQGQKASAVFNPETLLWVNAQHIQHGDPKRVAGLLQPFLGKAGVGATAKAKSEEWMVQRVLAFRERSKTLVEMAEAFLC